MLFKEIYNKAREELQKELRISSIEAVPKLIKVSLNVGAGVAVSDQNLIEKVTSELMQITGQKPIITKARKSIAGFKLRQGVPIGVAVTLRGQRMFDFLDRLVNVTLPRVRDFQGISKTSFDGHGNYTLGIREHIVFPEIILDNIEKTFGMSITIHTTASSDELAKKLLTKLHFPFKE